MSSAADAACDAEIARVFGARAELARSYAELLCGPGIVQGVIGPREADRIWSRHLFNSAALATLVPQRAKVVDLGSGAGLPGIPLGLARPDVSVTLLEPLARRVRFLDQALALLAVPNLTVHHGRAEAVAKDRSVALADVVAARAVAPLPRLVELAFPLLSPTGRLVALKGAAAADEAAEIGTDRRWIATVHSIDAFESAASVVEVVRAGDD